MKKEITLKVAFDSKYSYESVLEELATKLSPFTEYYDFEITHDKGKGTFESEESYKKRISKGERFIDW